jgi:hypothetical protein
MSNKEIFMIATIIHNLQDFHIYYGLYVVAKRFWILSSFFFLFCRISLFKRKIMRGYLKKIFMLVSFLFFRVYFQLNKERNFNIQDNIFQAWKEA